MNKQEARKEVADPARYVQTIILELADGREARYSGPVQIQTGDAIRDIQVVEPQPLADDCQWEVAHKRKNYE